MRSRIPADSRSWESFCLLGILLALASCAHIPIKIPSYSVTLGAPSSHLVGGVGIADITPAAAYPMAGHSLAGRVARGHWMRLYARAFYFRDATGSSVVFVSCDLAAIPAGLQEAAAAELHQEILRGDAPAVSDLPVPDIGRDNLILSGTHTHQSPGNYMSSVFYNGLISPYPGFDVDLFHFLARRIAEAVYAAKQDADMHPEELELVLHRRRVEDLTRNRSITAFAKDLSDVQEEILSKGPPPPPDCPKPCPRYSAVDPDLVVLELRRNPGSSVGAMIFFAVHPTVMSHQTAVFSPDFVGFAMRYVERESGSPGFVAGFFNGAEGDVSARWAHRDAEEARFLGKRLGDHVRSALQDKPEAVILNPSIQANRSDASQSAFCNGARPVPGVAEMGGAEDGHFITFDMGWRAPFRTTNPQQKSVDPEQGVKQPALDLKSLPWFPLTTLIEPAANFPDRVPVSVVRLGPLTIAAVPVEMTTAMGRHVRLKLAANGDPRAALLIGLANEYLGYVTTLEEYDTQDYEGASTLFGRHSGECYETLLVSAAGKLGSSEHSIPARKFDAGEPPFLGAKFGPPFWGSNVEFTDEELTAPFGSRTTSPPQRLARLEWTAAVQNRSTEKATEFRIGTPDRRATLLRQASPGQWIEDEDDTGGHLLTLLVNGGADGASWQLLWIPGEAVDLNAPRRLRVETRDGPICSVSFTLAALQTGTLANPLDHDPKVCPQGTQGGLTQ
jgi:Neutral/alkaline non-lysosomal ceramidase.